jgi:hypothetical protein
MGVLARQLWVNGALGQKRVRYLPRVVTTLSSVQEEAVSCVLDNPMEASLEVQASHG